MALSDSTTTSLITAAAGLAGAGIGGFSTYLANRAQWRRESRRTVYANLIGAAYEMDSFIESGLKMAVGPRTDTSAGAGRVKSFPVQPLQNDHSEAPCTVGSRSWAARISAARRAFYLSFSITQREAVIDVARC